MKTFNQFLDFILEDNKTSLTQAQIDQINRIRRSEGRLAASQFLTSLQSRRIRNLPPDKQKKALEKKQPERRLRPGEVLRFDKSENRWVSNLT
jgi:citrate lyase synthetase